MELTFNPTITGGFVHHCMNDSEVCSELEKLGIKKEESHNLIKSILIAGTRDLKFDLDRKIKIEITKAFREADTTG